MARWEQFEVWSWHDEKWELVGTFIDFEVAATIARSRRERVRLVRAIFEDSQRAQEETLMEIGSTRKAG